MALIVGIYRRLIAALSSGFSAVAALLRLELIDARDRFMQVEWRLILPLLAGIASALVVGARIIPIVLDAYPHESLGLFFGLVAGSIAIPWKRVERRTGFVIAVAVACAVAAFLLTGLPPREGGSPTIAQIFASAMVAICAMILPGVSGAFLLKVLGIYEATLAAVNALDVGFIAVFALGAAVGLGFFSKLLNFLLSRWSDVTMAALVGLMTGALRSLWPWQAADRSLQLPAFGEPVWSVVILAGIGFAFVSVLAFWGDRIEHRLKEAT